MAHALHQQLPQPQPACRTRRRHRSGQSSLGLGRPTSGEPDAGVYRPLLKPGRRGLHRGDCAVPGFLGASLGHPHGRRQRLSENELSRRPSQLVAQGHPTRVSSSFRPGRTCRREGENGGKGSDLRRHSSSDPNSHSSGPRPDTEARGNSNSRAGGKRERLLPHHPLHHSPGRRSSALFCQYEVDQDPRDRPRL